MIRTLQLACLALSAGAIHSLVLAQPMEWRDDFSAQTTYDSASLLAPCYGGPPTKYTLIDYVSSDVFNERAVSGNGKLLVSNRAMPVDPLLGRSEQIVLGWLGTNLGCDPGEPPWLESSYPFTSPYLCIYGGFVFNPWDLRLGTSSSAVANGRFGPDGAPGRAGVDDDCDGTTDEEDESPASRMIFDGNDWAYAPPFDFPDGGDADCSNAPSDGRPGVAYVDDDGNGTTDDIGETGLGNDPDDEPDRHVWEVAIKAHLLSNSGFFLHIDPGSYYLSEPDDPNAPTEQFSFWVQSSVYYGICDYPAPCRLPEGAGELGWQSFYEPYTHYNYVFCASGTCFGAMLWTEADMSNPDETLGPFPYTDLEQWPADELTVSLRNGPARTLPHWLGDEDDTGPFRIDTSPQVFVRQAAWLGNMNFSHTFWVCSGHPTGADFVNGIFGYPSPSADLDNDRDVDVNDHLTFSGCFAGSSVPPAPGCLNTQADLDGDGDVDIYDFLTFSTCFNGSLRRPNQDCFPLRIVTLPDCDPPENDTCEGAEPVAEGVFADEINAKVTVPPIHYCDTGPGYGRDVWYKYVPNCAGTATISTCDAGNLEDPIWDLVLTVYDGCGGNVLACAEADTSCGGGLNREVVQLPVTQSQPVWIQIAGDEVNDYGEFLLTITNDGAICGGESGGGGGSGGGESAQGGAGAPPQIFDGDTPVENVPYVYTPTCSGDAVFALCDSTGQDRSLEGIYFAVADPTSDAIVMIEAADCVDDQAKPAMSLTAGQPVYVQVFGVGGAANLEGFALSVACED